MSEWIRVEDRMPEAGDFVDVWFEDMRQCDIEYDGADFIEYSYEGCDGHTQISCVIDPSHWMPTPEPPSH